MCRRTTLVRDESVLYFEHLIRGDLNHVINLPQNFNFMNSYITFEGEIEANESGEFEFILYYSGYQTIYIGGKKVVDTRWRTFRQKANVMVGRDAEYD